MGRYYLVERATGLVLPIDGNGKLYITGKYPQLNKKLERTGKYSNLARKNNEYTDYIYKNQYSAVAESRKLDGSKAWDGYYLSYAKATSAMRSIITKPCPMRMNRLPHPRRAGKPRRSAEIRL